MKPVYRKAAGIAGAAGLGLVALGANPARAAPANTFQELWAELGACLRTAEATDGLDLTIVFSLKRDGALLGKPRITHSKSTDPADLRRAADAVARAMDKCLPFSITDALGGAIAGRPLGIRIQGKRKNTDV